MGDMDDREESGQPPRARYGLNFVLETVTAGYALFAEIMRNKPFRLWPFSMIGGPVVFVVGLLFTRKDDTRLAGQLIMLLGMVSFFTNQINLGFFKIDINMMFSLNMWVVILFCILMIKAIVDSVRFFRQPDIRIDK